MPALEPKTRNSTGSIEFPAQISTTTRAGLAFARGLVLLDGSTTRNRAPGVVLMYLKTNTKTRHDCLKLDFPFAPSQTVPSIAGEPSCSLGAFHRVDSVLR
jgi:hypothetical protein